MTLLGRAYKELYEDWTGADNISTAVADGITWLNSSDTGNTAFAIVADAQGLICQGATDATGTADMCEIAHQLLAWTPQHGELYMEARVKVSVGAMGSVAFNVGFNDDVLEDSNALPVTLSGTTFTSNSSTWIGAVYDGAATNADVHAFFVDDDSDTTTPIADLRMVSMTPVLDDWLTVAVRLTANPPATVAQGIAGTAGGSVVAEISVVEESTGKYAQKRFATSIDRNALLTPHIGFQTLSVAHTFEIDYIYVRMSRLGHD